MSDSDRTCESCNKVFKYPYMLYKHVSKSFDHCKLTNTQLETKSIKDETNEVKCVECNLVFNHRQSLYKHIRENRCKANNIPPIAIPLPPNNIINDNSLVVNGDNPIINNNGVINITNNTTIVQHINPFGFESTDFLTIKEKMEILNSGHMACIKILKIIYSRNENKNFYKVNKKSTSVSYIGKNMNLDVYQNQEFRLELFKNSTTLLYSIMIDCKESLNLSLEKQLELMDNITSIKNDVYSEIFKNELSNFRREMNTPFLDTETKCKIEWGLDNVIGQEIENNNDNNRKVLAKYIKSASTNPEVKAQFNIKVSNIANQRQKTSKEILDNKLDFKSVDEKFGTIEYSELENDLELDRYENTEFAKKLKEREKMEKQIVMENNTLGKLEQFSNYKKQREYKIEQQIKEKDMRINNIDNSL